jgi:hypothetical protein
MCAGEEVPIFFGEDDLPKEGFISRGVASDQHAGVAPSLYDQKKREDNKDTVCLTDETTSPKPASRMKHILPHG